MRPLKVVVTQPGTQRLGASPGARIGDGVSPVTKQGLDETLGFAVRLWSIGACPTHSDTAAARTLLKPSADVTAAVIGEHALHDDAASSKPVDGATQEGRGRGAGLIRKDFDVGRAAVVIDGDVDIFPARTDTAAARGMNPMADTENPTKRFDIEMYEFAWPRPLIAGDGRGRLEGRQSIEPKPREDRGDRRPR